MTKTKSGFLKAGSIIGVVMSALCAVFGLICFVGQKIVTRDFVVQVVFDCAENEYTSIENFDGSITYKLYKDGVCVKETTSEEVDAVASLTKATMTTMGVFSCCFAVAELVLSIFVLIATSNEKIKNSLIVSELVISLLAGNLLTFAFMIVALCLKNKPVEELDATSLEEPKQA